MRILITGATNGMGLGLARVLAEQGHELIVHGRSATSCEAIAEELRGLGSPAVSTVVADLTRLDDVRAAIRQLTDRFDSLDALFVNAGIGYAPAQVLTVDGMDAHFQVNYLSHVMLCLRLLPLLERSGAGRIVFNATNFGAIDWDDLQMKHGWGYERGVTQAMLAKRMFLVELQERLQARGSSVSCFGFHIEKAVWTNQLQIIPAAMRLMAGVMKLFGQFHTMEECGRIMAPLFTDDARITAERAGQLLTWDGEAITPIEHDVLDGEQRQRLWDLSLELCGDDATRQAAARLR